jgi:hypothetical protein
MYQPKHGYIQITYFICIIAGQVSAYTQVILKLRQFQKPILKIMYFLRNFD